MTCHSNRLWFVFLVVHMPICSVVLEYLPTFAQHKSPSHVGKYNIYGAYGMSFFLMPWLGLLWPIVGRPSSTDGIWIGVFLLARMVSKIHIDIICSFAWSQIGSSRGPTACWTKSWHLQAVLRMSENRAFSSFQVEDRGGAKPFWMVVSLSWILWWR